MSIMRLELLETELRLLLELELFKLEQYELDLMLEIGIMLYLGSELINCEVISGGKVIIGADICTCEFSSAETDASSNERSNSGEIELRFKFLVLSINTLGSNS